MKIVIKYSDEGPYSYFYLTYELLSNFGIIHKVSNPGKEVNLYSRSLRVDTK